MKQWPKKKFIDMVERNGYYYSRNNGSHSIYVNNEGVHITIPLRVKGVIAQRLIKEYNLKTD